MTNRAIRGKNHGKETSVKQSDADAERAPVRGVEVCLVNYNETKGATDVCSKEGGAEESIFCELLWREQQKYDAGRVAANLVDARDERLPHRGGQEIVPMVRFDRAVEVGRPPQSLQYVSCEGQQQDKDDGDTPHHRRRQPCDMSLAGSRPDDDQELATTATV